MIVVNKTGKDKDKVLGLPQTTSKILKKIIVKIK